MCVLSGGSLCWGLLKLCQGITGASVCLCVVVGKGEGGPTKSSEVGYSLLDYTVPVYRQLYYTCRSSFFKFRRQ